MPRALREALLEADADLPRQAAQPQPVEAEHDHGRDEGAGDAEPTPSARPAGAISRPSGGLGTVPEALAVRRHDPEPVRRRAEVRVDRLARGDGLAPALVEPVEPVAETDAVGSGKAHSGKGEGHPPRPGRNADRRPTDPIDVPSTDSRLEAGGERGGVARRAQGIDDGKPAGLVEIQMRPNEIGHHRPVPFGGLRALEPVEGAELRDLDRSGVASRRSSRADAQHLPGGRDPQIALPVLGQAEHLLAQRRREAGRHADAIARHDREPVAGPDPYVARGVFEHAVHVVRGQAVDRPVRPPPPARERAHAVRESRTRSSRRRRRRST